MRDNVLHSRSHERDGAGSSVTYLSGSHLSQACSDTCDASHQVILPMECLHACHLIVSHYPIACTSVLCLSSWHTRAQLSPGSHDEGNLPKGTIAKKAKELRHGDSNPGLLSESQVC